MAYPTVTKETVKEFGRRWDNRGIKMILDDTSIQFAMDFANVVLKSFVDDMSAKAAAFAKAKAQQKLATIDAGLPPTAAVATQSIPVPPAKSGIILTDA